MAPVPDAPPTPSGTEKAASWDWNLANGAVDWNDGLPALFGHAQTVTDAAWRESRIHPEDRERVCQSLQKATIVNDGTPWVESYRFSRADGSYVAVIERASVIRDDAGPCRVLGTIVPQDPETDRGNAPGPEAP